MESPPTQEAAPPHETRQGAIDRYTLGPPLGTIGPATLYAVTCMGKQHHLLLLELDRAEDEVGVPDGDGLVLACLDQGKHSEKTFLVYGLQEHSALSQGLYFGWDPTRLELIASIVSLLRTARDNSIDLRCRGWENLVAASPREVRFLSPIAAAAPDADLASAYAQTLREIVPKIVRNNFMNTLPKDGMIERDAPDDGDPSIWSPQFHTSPEVRHLLQDIVDGQLASLDDVFDAVNAFGVGRVVRKRTAWGTHRGLVRDSNEDALMLLEQTMVSGGRPLRVEFYAVADGMGGHEAGEIASDITLKSMAVEVVSGLNRTTARELGLDLLDHEFLKNVMTAAIERTNQKVRQYAWDAHSASRRKPGSTLVCALAIGPVFVLGHVGDSRAYKLLKDGHMVRVTHDHSPVQCLVDMQKLTAEEAFSHPQRHQISSNIGISPELLQRDVTCRYLQEGESLLLCSDGISDMLQDSEMEELYQQERDPRRLSRLLVDRACDRGGHDNISIVIVTRAEGPAQEQRETPPKV